MELRHLRYFVAVAEELHFRRAADRLHVAQPAVSEQVRKLEQELGVRLFHRNQRSVSLTSAGEAMFDEARHVLRQAEVARQVARNADDQAGMRLRIGYLPDSLPASVPRALRRLAAWSSAVEVDLTAGPPARLIHDVVGGRLDVVVTTLPAPANGLRVTRLGGQRAVAVLPLTHPLAVDAPVTFGQLAPDRLIVLPRSANPAFHNAVVAMCHSAGVAPTFVEPPDARVEHVLLAVAAGGGVALLPESVRERFASPGVRFVELESAGPVCDVGALSHRDTQSTAALAFLRALTRVPVDPVPRPMDAGRPALRLTA